MPRILIIEDEPQYQELLRRFLQDAGHQTETASDGVIGLASYNVETIDIVITDIVMPNQDGLGVIRELRRRNPAVKIIAITGGSRNLRSGDLLHVAGLIGANDTLIKPFEKAELLESVRNICSTPTVSC
jgi:DNA-binding response OmpR family regulator